MNLLTVYLDQRSLFYNLCNGRIGQLAVDWSQDHTSCRSGGSRLSWLGDWGGSCCLSGGGAAVIHWFYIF